RQPFRKILNANTNGQSYGATNSSFWNTGSNTSKQYSYRKAFRNVVKRNCQNKQRGSVPRTLNTFFFGFLKINVQMGQDFVQTEYKKRSQGEPCSSWNHFYETFARTHFNAWCQ